MKSGVAYQNKDVCSKVLTDWFGKAVFESYNVKIPEIKETRPTNLPEIQADELRLDCLFELADGSMAIVDYESVYRKSNWIKYGNYVVRILEELRRETGKMDHKVRIIILFTGNVKRSAVPKKFDVGAMKISIEPGFLSEIPKKKILKRIKSKVKKDQPMTGTEMVWFMILPLAYEDQATQCKMLKEMLELAKRIRDEEISKVVIAGLLVFGDKVIDDETAQEARRWLKMTKVERLIVEEQKEKFGKVIQEKDQTIQEKDQTIQEKDRAIQEKAQAIQEKDRAIQEKAQAIQEKDRVIKEKEQAVKEKDESFLMSIKGIMKSFKVTAMEAMNSMGLSEEERKKYASMLQQ